MSDCKTKMLINTKKLTKKSEIDTNINRSEKYRTIHEDLKAKYNDEEVV